MIAARKQDIALVGAGLGLRRVFADELVKAPEAPADFFEVAPENWMHLGGRLGRLFRALTERHPFVCHGLSLSLGGPSRLDESFLQDLKLFLESHEIKLYSEHLSFCGDDGLLYDLMPIPFTEEAAAYVTGRIRRVQDVLEQRIAIENISYYAAPGQEMTEAAFLKLVLNEADCDLLLDVNNVYVNSVNHGYDAVEFIASMPTERIAYLHIAGHRVVSENLIVDTHGAAIIDPVWQLLEQTYQLHGVLPTLIERDFNIPPLHELTREVTQVKAMLRRAAAPLRVYG